MVNGILVRNNNGKRYQKVLEELHWKYISKPRGTSKNRGKGHLFWEMERKHERSDDKERETYMYRPDSLETIGIC